MKPTPVTAAAIAVLLAVSATVFVWQQRAELPGSNRPDVNRREGSATGSESNSRKSMNDLPWLLKDPIRALHEMQEGGAQVEHGNTVADAPIEEALAKPPVEPSLFNVDDPPVGPHADQILTEQGMDAEELGDSEFMKQAPGSAIHSLSENAAHNEQIARGEARAEGRSIEPAEVDPDSHPPTN